MQLTKPLDKNIQFLITANYQRMVSFEQAAFLTNESSFKEFYLEKAEESEINIKQLQLMLPIANPFAENTVTGPVNTDAMLAGIFNGKKNPLKILASIKSIEKTIANWYKTTLKEIKDLPAEMVGLIEEQYKSVNNAQLQMECL
jgi:hypothetical protein